MTHRSQPVPGRVPAVSMVLVWVNFPDLQHAMRLKTYLGFNKASNQAGGPLLRPQAFPTAGILPGTGWRNPESTPRDAFLTAGSGDSPWRRLAE